MGDQRFSYNQEMSFRLRFKLKQATMHRKDLILEGGGIQVSRSVYDWVRADRRDLNLEDYVAEIFTFKIKETDGWRPTLSAKDFLKLISNLTAIKIKAIHYGNTSVENFQIHSAQKLPLSKAKELNATRVNWVEDCVCPINYKGQFCEKCRDGFKREFPFADSSARCVPCTCNNHSTSCDTVTGK